MAFPWTEVATVVAAGGAGAAWLAASASREAVKRANRPFVWPEWESAYDHEEGRWNWRVRLHNDGPGVALDVRWSVRVQQDDERYEDKLGSYPIPGMPEPPWAEPAWQPIRAMQPGDTYPRSSGEWLGGTSDLGAIEWVVVRFTDSAGLRWEYTEPSDPRELAEPVRRLRKVRHRSLRYRLWRLRHYPLRELLRSLPIRRRSDW